MKTFTFTTEAKGGDGKWSLEEIFKLQQGILAFFHIGLSVALYAASDGNSYAVPVRQIFNRWRSDTPGDGCDSLNSCTILQAEAQISGYTEGTNELGGTFDLVFIVPAFSLISGLHHLFAFVRPDYYLSTSKVANPWRMIDYVSSSSLMLAVNSVLFVSPGSLDTLFLTVAFMACIVLVGYAGEAAAATEDGLVHAKVAFSASLLLFLGYWAIQFSIFAANAGELWTNALPLYGDGTLPAGEAPPAVAWIFILNIFFSFLVFPIIYVIRLVYAGPDWTSKVTKYEIFYGCASFLAKIPLLTAYATGVLFREDNNIRLEYRETTTAITNTTADSENDTTLFIASGVVTGVCVLFGITYIYLATHRTSDLS